MDAACKIKLQKKAHELRCYMIIYVVCMNLMQIFAHLHKPTLWGIICMFMTSISFWILFLRSGFSAITSEMFSMDGYDVYVNGIKSEEKKEEMQQNLDIAGLVLTLIVSAFGMVLTAILLLLMTIKLLVRAIYSLKRDKAFSHYLFKSVGVSWLISLVAFILLTIWINII